jgi:hypothetical protein
MQEDLFASVEIDDSIDSTEDTGNENLDPNAEYIDDEAEETTTEETEETEDNTEEETSDELTALQTTIATLGTAGIEFTDEELSEATDVPSLIQGKLFKAAVGILNSQLETLNMAEREAVETILQGGTLEDVLELRNAATYSYSDEQIEDDPTLALQLIKTNLKRKNLSDKQIERQTNGLADDELVEEALEALRELKATEDKGVKKLTLTEKRKAEQEAMRKQQEAKAVSINKAVSTYFAAKDEVVPGLKLKKETKAQIEQQALPTINKVYTDLEKYAPILAVLDYYGVLEGDFSKIRATAKTEVVGGLKKLLGNKKPATGSTSVDDTSFDDVFAAARKAAHKAKK